MREEILSIASDLREGSMTTDEAREQLLRLFGIIEKGEQLINFCSCKKPWGVGGRCVVCENPIKF